MHRDSGEQSWNNPDVREYFTALPAFIQESIKQSGMDFSSVEELKEYVQHYKF